MTGSPLTGWYRPVYFVEHIVGGAFVPKQRLGSAHVGGLQCASRFGGPMDWVFAPQVFASESAPLAPT